MAHSGTLILSDEQGQERRIPCGGGLDTYRETDGEVRVRGVVSVADDHMDQVIRLLQQARQGGTPSARYSGEVYEVDRRSVRRVDDLPMRIESIDETGNVRVESDAISS